MGDPELGDPAEKESVGTGLCSDGSQWNGLGPMGHLVHTHEEVGEPPRQRKGADEVDMHMGEGRGENWNLLNWGTLVALEA